MRFVISVIFLMLILASCGPSAEEREKQRIQDSIHAEEDRLRSIEDADAFILGVQEDNDSLAQTEE